VEVKNATAAGPLYLGKEIIRCRKTNPCLFEKLK
jgi:hypothetical protein